MALTVGCCTRRGRSVRLGVVTFTVGLLGIGAERIALGQANFTNYQGELRIGDVPFDGTALAKFAIVSDGGLATLWSHDGTSAAGSEPVSHVELHVIAGVFNVLLGAPPMEPLTSALLSNAQEAALRAWFNTGNGFERLPDQPFGSAPFAQICDLTNQIGHLSTGYVPRWNGEAFESGTIFDNGSVGIGTSNPVARLDVAGALAINGQIVVNGSGQWVGEPGIGPPGPQGPVPQHEWTGTRVRFELPDGTWPPLFVDLRGPAPAHSWSGTGLRFMNPDGTWPPSFVDLRGPVGPPGPTVSTFAVCDSGCCQCTNGFKRVGGADAPCQVTSDAGSCSQSEGSCIGGYNCCVCAPN